jgi:hypothetical protein
MATTQQAGPQLLYHFLRIGVSILAAVFLVLRFSGFAPLMPADDGSQLIAYVMAAIAVVLVLAGIFILKPRVPSRARGQSSAEYWAATATAKRALSVWFILEGAATFAAVGFLMTGHAVAGAAMVLAVVVFWIVTPETFEKA